MRRLRLFVVAVSMMAVLVGAGVAEADLDTSFGEGGVATVKPPAASGWTTERIEAAATGQDGETFAIAHQGSCSAYPCSQGDFVFRYLADGALEPSFAGTRGYEIPSEATNQYEVGQPLVTVASSGLPIVGRVVKSPGASGAIVVRRLLLTGELDTSFAAAGAVRLPCPCDAERTQLLAGPKNSIFVVATSETRKKQNGQKSGATASATLIKLDSAGHRAKGFGSRGSVTAKMPGEGEVEYDALTPEGATYFGGRGLTKSTNAGFLVRISAKGKFDGKLKQRSMGALGRLNSVKGNEVRVTVAVVGNNGPIELFGSAGSIGGFELRLHPDGTLARGWGEDGLALLPFPIAAAVQGRDGSTMALTGEEAAPPRVLRILGTGKLDPSFGKSGETLAGATGTTGYSLFPAGIGRVVVSELGQTECSRVCEGSGKLYRFLEGS